MRFPPVQALQSDIVGQTTGAQGLDRVSRFGLRSFTPAMETDSGHRQPSRGESGPARSNTGPEGVGGMRQPPLAQVTPARTEGSQSPRRTIVKRWPGSYNLRVGGLPFLQVVRAGVGTTLRVVGVTHPSGATDTHREDEGNSPLRTLPAPRHEGPSSPSRSVPIREDSVGCDPKGVRVGAHGHNPLGPSQKDHRAYECRAINHTHTSHTHTLPFVPRDGEYESSTRRYSSTL